MVDFIITITIIATLDKSRQVSCIVVTIYIIKAFHP
jgi:hypothetical protein